MTRARVPVCLWLSLWDTDPWPCQSALGIRARQLPRLQKAAVSHPVSSASVRSTRTQSNGYPAYPPCLSALPIRTTTLKMPTTARARPLGCGTEAIVLIGANPKLNEPLGRPPEASTGTVIGRKNV